MRKIPQLYITRELLHHVVIEVISQNHRTIQNKTTMGHSLNDMLTKYKGT